MEPNKLGIRHSRQWGKRNRGLVGDLLKKINHAVKSSPHFRLSLSSVINSSAGPQHGHQAKLTMRGDGNRDTSQGVRTNNSSTILTIIPDHDRYRWRKYGEKKIGKSKFPRSYYRCTYHSELNCSATKQVQQCTDDDGVPMYKVSYFNEHSCKPCNHVSLHNTNATNNSEQVLDFTAKEISTINIPVWQQYSASSDIMNTLQIFDGIPIVNPSVISYLQTSDQGQIGFGGMEMDLSWYQPKNMEG